MSQYLNNNDYYDRTLHAQIAKADWDIRYNRQSDKRYCWLANVINVYLFGQNENWPVDTDPCIEAGAAFVETWLLGSFRYIDCPGEKEDLLKVYLKTLQTKPKWVYDIKDDFSFHQSFTVCRMHSQICDTLKKRNSGIRELSNSL